MHPWSPTSRFTSRELDILQMVTTAGCNAPTKPSWSTCASRGRTPSDIGKMVDMGLRSAPMQTPAVAGHRRRSRLGSVALDRLIIMRTMPSSVIACRTTSPPRCYLLCQDCGALRLPELVQWNAVKGCCGMEMERPDIRVQRCHMEAQVVVMFNWRRS